MKKGNKPLLSTVLGASVLLGSNTMALAFTDVPASSPAKKGIDYLNGKGIIQGYTKDLFKPNEAVSRGQFATFISRALKLPAASYSFSDLPKSSSLYDGVSRAAKVGIIKGSGSKSLATQKVSRADMAVMLDRAMQYQAKNKYTSTKTLTYKDKNQISAYAVKSVERLAYYNIVPDKTTGYYKPKDFGTRGETAQSIYNMLMLFNGSNPSTPPSNGGSGSTDQKEYLTMTLAQLKEKYGSYPLVIRVEEYDKEHPVSTIDLMDIYYRTIHDPEDGFKGSPSEFLKQQEQALKNEYLNRYFTSYPKVEVFSYKGKAFRDSELFVNNNPAAYGGILVQSYIPNAPKLDGKFLIDLHTNSKAFATYQKDSVKVHEVNKASYVKDGVLMMEIKDLFNGVPGFSIVGSTMTLNGVELSYYIDGKTVKVGDKTIELAAPIQGGRGQIFVPVRSFCEAFNLDVRVSAQSDVPVIQIANYPQEKIEGIWQ